MSEEQALKKELKAVKEELKKAKAYFKRTNDRTVAITEEQYLHLLDFKAGVLKKVLSEKTSLKSKIARLKR